MTAYECLDHPGPLDDATGHVCRLRPVRYPAGGCVLRDYDDAIATLAASRESQGLSLADVVHHAKGSRGSLSEALRGKHELGGARLFALADALGYDLALIPREES